MWVLWRFVTKFEDTNLFWFSALPSVLFLMISKCLSTAHHFLRSKYSNELMTNYYISFPSSSHPTWVYYTSTWAWMYFPAEDHFRILLSLCPGGPELKLGHETFEIFNLHFCHCISHPLVSSLLMSGIVLVTGEAATNTWYRQHNAAN